MTTIDLAVAGCSSLVGEALLDVLAERAFPLGQLHLLDTEAQAGEKVTFNQRRLTVQPLEAFDFSQAQLALFALPESLVAEYAPQATAAGCSVIDTSAQFRLDERVPLVVPEVNPEQLQGLAAGSIIASPSPVAVLLGMALQPLQQAVGIERLDATVCYPASMAGRAGVEELATQTADLLNARPVKARVFPKQLAFNLLPQVGGGSKTEAAILAELRRLLNPSLSMGLSLIQAPVFYGLAATVHVQTRDSLPLDEARQLLATATGLQLVDETSKSGYPTPVTDAMQQDKVFLGRLRDDGSRSKSLNFWIVADNVRKGAAINVIQLAERLVRGNG